MTVYDDILEHTATGYVRAYEQFRTAQQRHNGVLLARHLTDLKIPKGSYFDLVTWPEEPNPDGSFDVDVNTLWVLDDDGLLSSDPANGGSDDFGGHGALGVGYYIDDSGVRIARNDWEDLFSEVVPVTRFAEDEVCRQMTLVSTDKVHQWLTDTFGDPATGGSN